MKKLYLPVPGLTRRRALIRGMTDTSQVGMQQGDRTYSIDANAFLSDGAAAYTATGWAQYAGSDGIFDGGGNQNVTITMPAICDVASLTPQQARLDAALILDVTAIKTSSGNELYKIILEGSNDAAFGAGNCFMLAMFEMGHSSVLDTFNGATTAAPAAIGGSRIELPFSTEQNNVKYQYVKIRNVISGTTPSITYKAVIGVLMEP